MQNNIEIQRIAAKAVIANDKNEILLLREASTYADGTNIGKYMLPGGRIEVGEPYFDGLKREIREEAGLEVVVGDPLLVSEWFPVIRGVSHQIVAIFFACKAVTTAVTLSSEHDHFMWVDVQSLADYQLKDSDRQAIQKWLGLQLIQGSDYKPSVALL